MNKRCQSKELYGNITNNTAPGEKEMSTKKRWGVRQRAVANHKKGADRMGKKRQKRPKGNGLEGQLQSRKGGGAEGKKATRKGSSRKQSCWDARTDMSGEKGKTREESKKQTQRIKSIAAQFIEGDPGKNTASLGTGKKK